MDTALKLSNCWNFWVWCFLCVCLFACLLALFSFPHSCCSMLWLAPSFDNENHYSAYHRHHSVIVYLICTLARIVYLTTCHPPKNTWPTVSKTQWVAGPNKCESSKPWLILAQHRKNRYAMGFSIQLLYAHFEYWGRKVGLSIKNRFENE